MAISAISSISGAQTIQSTSTASLNNSLQNALQSLQKSLASNDLTGAKAAFANVQRLNKTLASKAAFPDNQLTTDIAALGTALNKGDLAAAKAASTTVRNDTLTGNARAITAAATLASNVAQQVDAILGTFSPSGAAAASLFGDIASKTSTIAEQTTSYLSKVYGSDAVSTDATGTKVNVTA